MKRKFLSLIVAILAVIISCGVCATVFADTAATGAETKPFFNYVQPGAEGTIAYDKTTNVYTLTGHNPTTPRLSAVDGELQTLKDTYGDDTIKFSYQYAEIYDTPLQASDWFMYFTFRNLDESPCWTGGYGVHILFFQDQMKVNLNFNGTELDTKSVKFDSIYDDNYQLVDMGYHAVEISIDDANGTFTVYRDKGTEKEVSISFDCNLEYNGRVSNRLLDTGCYSFSVRQCKANIKDVYFFNSKNTEVDDEVARYEAYVKSLEEDNQGEPEEPEEPENKGCGGVVVSSSVVAAFGLTSLGGIVLLKKKEN